VALSAVRAPQVPLDVLASAIARVSVPGRYAECQQQQHLSDLEYGRPIVDAVRRSTQGAAPPAALRISG